MSNFRGRRNEDLCKLGKQRRHLGKEAVGGPYKDL